MTLEEIKDKFITTPDYRVKFVIDLLDEAYSVGRISALEEVEKEIDEYTDGKSIEELAQYYEVPDSVAAVRLFQNIIELLKEKGSDEI